MYFSNRSSPRPFLPGTIRKNTDCRVHGLVTDSWDIGFKDRQGDLWLGSQQGLTRITPPPFRINTIPPPIYITNVNVLEKEVHLAQLRQLSHKQNYIRFQFVGLCFSAPESVVYRYKLEDIDTRWRETQNPSVPYRYLHPARFQQVVINLCQNAAHAMPDGGELTVMLSNSRDNDIQLQVNDTGTGIEADVLDKIFNPLFTTKENGKGTGLGLFVVQQIVNRYNGTIQVQSDPGKGTIFTIRFPSAINN